MYILDGLNYILGLLCGIIADFFDFCNLLFFPDDAVVKMMPATFIFPGAIINHPKHVFMALSVADESTMNVDSDSDLGGMENPIEVSSSEGESSGDEVEELFGMDSGNNSVCFVNDDPSKSGDPAASESELEGTTDGEKPSEKEKASEQKHSPMEVSNSSPPPGPLDEDSSQSSSNHDSVPSQKRPSSSVVDDDDEPNGKTPRLSEKTADNEKSELNEELPVTEHGDGVC